MFVVGECAMGTMEFSVPTQCITHVTCQHTISSNTYTHTYIHTYTHARARTHYLPCADECRCFARARRNKARHNAARTYIALNEEQQDDKHPANSSSFSLVRHQPFHFSQHVANQDLEAAGSPVNRWCRGGGCRADVSRDNENTDRRNESYP